MDSEINCLKTAPFLEIEMSSILWKNGMRYVSKAKRGLLTFGARS